MTLRLFENHSPNNYVNKTIVQSGSDLNGTLREECSVVNPVITINISNPTNCNYAQIVEFNRYYYITDMVSISNNIWQLTLHVDVLYTYRESFGALPCTISKQENLSWSNKNYDDGTFKATPETEPYVIDFPATEEGVGHLGFIDNPEYILITAGPGYSA